MIGKTPGVAVFTIRSVVPERAPLQLPASFQSWLMAPVHVDWAKAVEAAASAVIDSRTWRESAGLVFMLEGCIFMYWG